MSHGIKSIISDSWIKHEIRKNLRSAEDKEGKDEPYDEFFDKIDVLLGYVNPNQKEATEYSTQNSEDEKVSFLSKQATIYYDWLGDYETALRFYQELDDLVFGHAKIRKGFGDCLRKLGKHEEAITKYDEALDNYFYDEKLDASILNSKALSHIELSKTKPEELDTAKEDLEKAVEYDSENVLYLINLGRVLDLQKKTGEALEMYQKAQDLIMVGTFGEGLEAEHRQFLEELFPRFLEFQTTMKANECIFQSEVKSFENHEVNEVLNLEKFKIEYREKRFCKARADKESNIPFFKELFNQIVAERRKIIEDKENELTQKMKSLKNIEEDLKAIKHCLLKKELQTGLNDWKKNIYKEIKDEDKRKKLVQYFDGFAKTFEFIYTASMMIRSDQAKLYPSLVTELTIKALIASFSWIPDQVSEKIPSIAEFLTCEAIQILSSSLLDLGNETQFAQRIGEVAYNIIKNPVYQKKIFKIKTEDLKQFSDNLRNKAIPFENKFPDQLKAVHYEKLYQTPAARLSNRDASLFVATWVPSAKISEKAVLEELTKIMGNQLSSIRNNKSTTSQETLKDQIYKLLKKADECRDEPNQFNPIFDEIEKKLPFEVKIKASVRHEIDPTENKMNYLSKCFEILYDVLGDYKEALECYKELEQLFLEPNAKVFKGLGDCMRKLGDHEEALKQYNEALEILDFDEDNDNSSLRASILNNQALSLIERGQLDKAIEALKKAIEYEDQNPLYPVTLGKVFSEQNNTKDALDYFEKAHEILKKPGSIIHPANKTYLEVTLPTIIELTKMKRSLVSQPPLKEPELVKKKIKMTDEVLQKVTIFDVFLKVREKILSTPGFTEAELREKEKEIIQQEQAWLDSEVKNIKQLVFAY